MTTETLVPVLSLFVALAAAIFGPLVTLRIARRQFVVNLAIASAQVSAPVRERWLKDIREAMAELLGLSLHYYRAGMEECSETDLRHLAVLEEKVRLMLDPADPEHEDLVKTIRSLVAGAEGDRRALAVLS